MPDQFPQITTQRQNPQVSQAAFGDYRYGASLARAADTVSQVSQVLKEKQRKRDVVKFQLKNREAVDTLKAKDLSASEFMEGYTQFFEESVSNFDEDLQDELKGKVYYRTLDSTDFKNHVADLEGAAVQGMFEEVAETYTTEWIQKEGGVISDDLSDFHATISDMEFSSKDQEAFFKKKMAEIEEIALINADSLEEFDKMLNQAQFADKSPSRVMRIRNSVERELGRLSEDVKGRASSEIKSRLSQAKDPTFKQGEDAIIDPTAFIELGASEEDIKNIYLNNLYVQTLKSRSFFNPEYFESLADPERMEATLKAMGVDEENLRYILDNKTEINAFQNLASYYQELSPAERVQNNPLVRKHIEEGNLVPALNASMDFYGHPPKGTPEEDRPMYMGMSGKTILISQIPPDIIEKYTENMDPETVSARDILAYRTEMEGKLGPKWIWGFDVAVIDSLTKGTNGIDKDPKLASFLASSQFLTPQGMDILIRGYTDTDGKRRMLRESGKDAEELDAYINTQLFESGFAGVFKDALQGLGTDVMWENFEDTVRTAVYAMADGDYTKVKTAAKEVQKAFSLKYYMVDAEGSQGTIVVPTDHHILVKGPIDRLRETLSNAFATPEERSSPYYKDSVQKSKWKDSLEEATANPFSSMPFRYNGRWASTIGFIPGSVAQAENMLTMISNVARKMEGTPKKMFRDRPFTIYNPERFYWEGAPDDNQQQMYRRLVDGWFRPTANYRVENAFGPNGEMGLRFYAPSKSIDGENVDAEEAIYDVPLIDRGTGLPAFIPFTELGAPDE